jgi:hypothetical protein
MYRANGNKIEFVSRSGEVDADAVAVCEQAEQAVVLLNKCGYLNDVQRKYSAAARAMAQAEELAGFRWLTWTQRAARR